MGQDSLLGLLAGLAGLGRAVVGNGERNRGAVKKKDVIIVRRNLDSGRRKLGKRVSLMVVPWLGGLDEARRREEKGF
ncbi:hypothetical protein DL95DRAFT_380673 [Leptodontidium sp. 2 PMI_412]|nr:hypothetical protein DL95DRAFT_380673 [Leptodontidium sp. 2 PMI_412]